jgi:Glycosyltransferase 61
MLRIISKLIHKASPEVCMNVAAWATGKGYQVKVLHPPVIEEVRPYVKDDRVAQAEFTTHHDALEREQTLVTIEGATIRDLVGFVELPGGEICYEGNWWLPYLRGHPTYKRRFALKRRPLNGNVYSLLCLWGSEFYHWFHDVLPRLETALPHLPGDTRFLINSSPKAWQLDSLTAAFGIGPDRLEIQPAGMHTRVERLWFATPLGHSSLGSGVVVRKVANRLRHHFKVDDSVQKAHRRVYISRAKATSRRVVNENEIAPLLQEHGFEKVLCEDLSLAEQVNLFAKTAAIVGGHGAGLTNLIYCESGSLVGEIYIEGVPPAYLVMSRQLDMRFSRFKADTLQIDRNQVEAHVNTGDFGKWIVNCLDLCEDVAGTAQPQLDAE